MSETRAFFEPTADGLVPVPEAGSPWSPEMLHGRLLAGLAAREADRHTPEPFRLARLTLDMYRFPPMEPVTVTGSLVRDGRRVRVLNVSLACAGREVARAVALMLRTGARPAVTLWSAPEWTVPLPDDLPESANVWAGWEFRAITPDTFQSAGRKQVWMRDTWQLVAGEELAPVVRAALASDLPNPLANSGPEGLRYINADLTMSITRPPATDWIGLEVSGHLAQDGIAIGSCTLYDVDGAIGWSSVCAVTND